MSAIHDVLARLTRYVMLLTSIATGTILAVIVSIVGAEIVNRSLLGGSFPWVYESLQLLGNWLYFLGIALVYDRSDDISIDWLYAKLPRSSRRIGLFIVHLVILISLVVLAAASIDLMEIQSRATSMGLGIPNHLFSLPILIGACFMMLSVLRQILAIALGRPEWKEIDGACET